MAMNGSPVGKLTPTSVERALEADTRRICAMVRTLEAELVRFQDVSAFKRSLRDYRTDV
jgi:hypothetical protein